MQHKSSKIQLESRKFKDLSRTGIFLVLQHDGFIHGGPKSIFKKVEKMKNFTKHK